MHFFAEHSIFVGESSTTTAVESGRLAYSGWQQNGNGVHIQHNVEVTNENIIIKQEGMYVVTVSYEVADGDLPSAVYFKVCGVRPDTPIAEGGRITNGSDITISGYNVFWNNRGTSEAYRTLRFDTLPADGSKIVASKISVNVVHLREHMNYRIGEEAVMSAETTPSGVPSDFGSPWINVNGFSNNNVGQSAVNPTATSGVQTMPCDGLAMVFLGTSFAPGRSYFRLIKNGGSVSEELDINPTLTESQYTGLFLPVSKNDELSFATHTDPVLAAPVRLDIALLRCDYLHNDFGAMSFAIDSCGGATCPPTGSNPAFLLTVPKPALTNHHSLSLGVQTSGLYLITYRISTTTSSVTFGLRVTDSDGSPTDHHVAHSQSDTTWSSERTFTLALPLARGSSVQPISSRVTGSVLVTMLLVQPSAV